MPEASAAVGLAGPLGPMEATAHEGRLVGVRFCWDMPARTFGDDPVLGRLAAWFERYWSGAAGDELDEPHGMDADGLPLDWSGLSGFRRAVLEATAAVPFGRTTTYGQLATALGRRGQARAVGSALRTNPWVVLVPCHRVLAANGALTGYAGGPTTGGHLDVKAALLDHERQQSAPSLWSASAGASAPLLSGASASA